MLNPRIKAVAIGSHFAYLDLNIPSENREHSRISPQITNDVADGDELVIADINGIRNQRIMKASVAMMIANTVAKNLPIASNT